MRKNLVFIFILFVTIVNAQKTKVDQRITYSKQATSLDEIFADLEKQYGIRFSYASQSISNQDISVDFQEEPMADVLEFLLNDSDLEYKIVANNILLRKSSSYKEDKNELYKKSTHIKGKITNSGANTGLNFATVSVSNSSIGTYTDEQGRFDIEIPSEFTDELLSIQYIGFESAEFKISELGDEFLIVPMNESQYTIDEITIVNKEKPINIGNQNNAITLNNSQISSSTSGVMGNDIGRQLQLMPGITAHDDNSAEIKIRGSNSEETLMMLDGMPIYNANHYYGIFSGVNTAYIDSVNLFKNIYPLEYGGKTAGLVELFSDVDIAKTTNGSVNIDLLTVSGEIKIPLNSKSDFSVAARKTTTDVNNKQFNTVNSPKRGNQELINFNESIQDQNSDPSFQFYDINAKYQWINDANKFQVNFFRSADFVDNSFQFELEDNKENNIKLEAIEDQSWSTAASSMIWDSKINKWLNWKTRAFFSQYKNEDNIDIKLDKKHKPGSSTPPPNIESFAELESQQNNELTDRGIDSHIDFKIKNHSLKVGLTTTHHDIDYSFEDNNRLRLQGKESFLEIGGYAGYNTQISNKLYLGAGLRSIYYSNIDEFKFSPRISARYSASQVISFKAAYGLEQQVMRQLDYDYRNQPMQLWVAAGTNEIPLLTSSNFMIGSTVKLGYINIDMEIYQKNKTGVLEYSVPTPSNPSNSGEQEREYQLFVGDGITRGMDLILGSGYKSYETYLSYTLSSSEQQFSEIFKNKLFPSENDRRHQFKWINNLTTGNFIWGLNAIYVSGLPYIDIKDIQPNGNIRDINPNSIRKRLPAYHRIDLSSTYRFRIGKINSSFSLSVFNLFNTKNVKYIQSVATEIIDDQTSTNTILGTETNLLNRTINLGLRIDF